MEMKLVAMKSIPDHFRNKIVVITGGTGSFGHAFLDKILGLKVKEIRVFSRDEKKQDDMRRAYKNNKRINYYIGDVRSKKSLDNCFDGADYVFHAAALKQVPSYPEEAIETNIMGSSNVIQSCIDCGVKRLVMLSTDKAVYPINAMGMTKALMEKLMISKARIIKNNTLILSCTRYGNVMGSRGSVIPLFFEQLKDGKDLTVTDPNMTRFLMSLEESVNLVLYAFLEGRQGDIFVQKSPSATVLDIAKASKVILNKPETKIHIIGTRHGEKLYEVLISREEMKKAIDLGQFYRIPIDKRGLDYPSYFSKGDKDIGEKDDLTSHNAKRLKQKELIALIKKLNFE